MSPLRLVGQCECVIFMNSSQLDTGGPPVFNWQLIMSQVSAVLWLLCVAISTTGLENSISLASSCESFLSLGVHYLQSPHIISNQKCAQWIQKGTCISILKNIYNSWLPAVHSTLPYIQNSIYKQFALDSVLSLFSHVGLVENWKCQCKSKRSREQSLKGSSRWAILFTQVIVIGH